MSAVLSLNAEGDLVDRRFLIICDHASNFVPSDMRSLGLPQSELERHIAYDPGALDVAIKISEQLNCPLIASQFSRLLIDPNRGLDDPTLVVKLSDGAVIPGNKKVDPFQDKAAWQARINDYYRPYNTAIEAAIKAALADDAVPIILSVHSFTPIWRGTPRPWHAAVLWDKDDRLRNVMWEYMRAQDNICFGDNEPYSGHLKNDCLYRHGTQNGLPHALIELRQDEIADMQGQTAWAAHMVAILKQAAAQQTMQAVAKYGSVNDTI